MTISSHMPSCASSGVNVGPRGVALDLDHLNAFSSKVLVLPPNQSPQISSWPAGVTAPRSPFSKAINNPRVVNKDGDGWASVPQRLQEPPRLGTQRGGEVIRTSAIDPSNYQSIVINYDCGPTSPLMPFPVPTADRAIRENIASELEVSHFDATTPANNKPWRRQVFG